ncbi:hypothetical protein R1sor_004145 [Riccia sorocarpa]|uniref:Uncharacterized protein n=1 Tax=Riccia sorocarpa TaxID=122646 RepID=A0ABD3H4C5_9MARC
MNSNEDLSLSFGGYYPNNPESPRAARGPYYWCGLYGHIQSFCQVDLDSSKKEGQVILSANYTSPSDSSNGSSSNESNSTTSSVKPIKNDSDTRAEIAMSAYSLKEVPPSTWYLDSGACKKSKLARNGV